MLDMLKVSLTSARDMFEIMSENQYSVLWDIAKDFECNGHTVSFKSHALNHIVIDDHIVSIAPNTVYGVDGNDYPSIDYAMMCLSR